MIRTVPHIAAMAPYALADMRAPKGKRLISLCQNESLRQPSPSVAEAIVKSTQHPQLYPDPDWTDLRHAIAGLHEVEADLIVCGNGSLDLIGCLARALLDPDSAAIVPAHAYPFFRSAVAMTGARLDLVAEADVTVDEDAILTAVTPETRIVFLANPANPTGTRISGARLRALRDRLPDHVVMAIDEAYGEFADHLAEPVFDLITRGDTVVLRSFSKAYGLAGLRIGWGLFPPAIRDEVRKLLNPNNVALPGQLAALAAVTDQAYMQETCRLTADLRDRSANRLRYAGLTVPESFTNFLLLRFASADAANVADGMLRAEGVFLRPQTGVGLPESLRMTVGTQEEMDIACDLLERWCCDQGGQA